MKIRVGAVDANFVNGVYLLVLPADFIGMPTIFAQIVDHGADYVITGCNPMDSININIGCRKVSDGTVANANLWIRYFAIGV